MTESKSIMSLNSIRKDFASEDLEPRLEMQLLGLGCDPRVTKHYKKGQLTKVETVYYYSYYGYVSRKK